MAKGVSIYRIIPVPEVFYDELRKAGMKHDWIITFWMKMNVHIENPEEGGIEELL